VARELRVAARQRSTFWVRVAAAITGLVIGCGGLALSQFRGFSSAQLGGILFTILTWICLGAALGAGLFFTSDCLSEEKREGTLGLLFLTDLRGYDIVLGKLLATSLRGAYALLAVLPVLAVTQLMGGVTGPQYWKTSLALINALFCSLVAGILVSSISRDSQKAMAATLLLLLLLAIGGPIADAISAAIRKAPFQPVCCLTSPAYILVTASAWGRSPYWHALLLSETINWLMLGLACALVPYTWQERRRTTAGASRSWGYRWKYGGARRREKVRRRLLEQQPIAWLACRERWQSLSLWAVAVLTTAAFLAVLSRTVPPGAWIMWNYVGGLFTIVLYLWIASQAVRFLIEVRRSGMTELLLISPVSEREIITGQWRGLLRMFGIPLLLLLSVQVGAAVLSQATWQKVASQASTAASSALTNQSGMSSNQNVAVNSSVSIGVSTGTTTVWTSVGAASTREELILTSIVGIATGLATLGNLLALYWFGTWMGLTSRSANLGTLKTILFVQIIPWFVIAFAGTFGVGMLMMSSSLAGSPAGSFIWWPVLSAVVAAALAIAKDVGFIVWARKRLYSSFREQAAQLPEQPRFIAPPLLPVAPKATT
jgi:ABC-type transport system involved in multi-copper enzyme maturation permease subunit